MVREMEREFKTAYDLDEHFDYAGAARCLGLLYRDAPGWPLSVGSRHKARDWLEQAVKLAPGYPDNQLNLIESYWQWKDHEAASNALQNLTASGRQPGRISPAKPGNKIGPTGPPGGCRPRKNRRKPAPGKTLKKSQN